MKIFYLITKSEIGGAQTHVFQLSKYFLEKGNKVALMSCPGGWLEKKAKELGVKFYGNKYLSNNLNPFFILKSAKEIRKATKDFQPDLMCCHSTMTGFLGRIIIKNKIPTIFTAHGWAFTDGLSFLRKSILIIAEKFAAQFCSKIICVSEFDKKLALKYQIAPVKKIITIHNGVKIIPIIVSKVNYPKSRMQIVFMGRLNQQKDPLLLLRAFYNLSPFLRKRFKIKIIGGGPKREELEKFIEENNLANGVELLGEMSREKAFQILKKSDIFVLTSNWEGFPYSILEAMNYGLVVIASNVGGVKEAINYNCGFLVERGDERKLRQILEKIMKDPLLIKKIGSKARIKVKTDFSLKKMLGKTMNEYNKVLKSNKI